MSASDQFSALFDRHAIASHDKQLRVAELCEQSDWQVDFEQGELHLGNGRRFQIQLLGSEAEEDDSWLWAWANRQSELPDSVTYAARRLREMGERLHTPELTTGHFQLDDLNGHAIAMLGVGLLRADGYYCAPIPGGSAYLLITGSPELKALNTDTPEHVIGRITESLSRADLNHLPAVGAYLSYKGYKLDFAGKILTATSADGDEVVLEFDDLDRLRSMSTTRHADSEPATRRWWPWRQRPAIG